MSNKIKKKRSNVIVYETYKQGKWQKQNYGI